MKFLTWHFACRFPSFLQPQRKTIIIMRNSITTMAAGLGLILAAGNIAHSADIAVPAGLQPGDTFRFVYVTNATTDPTSSDISYYNGIVATDALGYTFNGNPITWNSMVSTAAVDARDNVGGFGSNVPVYLTSGSKIANDMTTGSGGLWSGTAFVNVNAGIDGQPVVGPFVWTGTNSDGTKSATSYMGNGGITRYGRTDQTSNWNDWGTAIPSLSFPMFALSAPQTVPVPEPSTYVMGTIGVMLVGFLARRRRARKA